jgi:hypothetical protein
MAKKLIDYSTMYPEVVDLCKVINALPGVITTESCYGHGETTYKIWFKVDGSPLSRLNENSCLQGLFFLTRCLDKRYFEFGDQWAITLSVGDMYTERGLYPTMFLLESKALGESALVQAQSLIKNMEDHLNNKNFKKGFSIDIGDFKVKEANGNYMFDV